MSIELQQKRAKEMRKCSDRVVGLFVLGLVGLSLLTAKIAQRHPTPANFVPHVITQSEQEAIDYVTQPQQITPRMFIGVGNTGFIWEGIRTSPASNIDIYNGVVTSKLNNIVEIYAGTKTNALTSATETVGFNVFLPEQVTQPNLGDWIDVYTNTDGNTNTKDILGVINNAYLHSSGVNPMQPEDKDIVIFWDPDNQVHSDHLVEVTPSTP